MGASAIEIVCECWSGSECESDGVRMGAIASE